MVYIISKRDGPHREGVAAKDFLQKNRTTINSLANHLTLGRWQQLRNPDASSATAAIGQALVDAAGSPKEVEPYVRISHNGRVVIADLATGRRLDFVGELRGSGQSRYFALATRENGIFEPLDDELYKALADLEGVSVLDETSEAHLEQIISGRLGLDPISRSVE